MSMECAAEPASAWRGLRRGAAQTLLIVLGFVAVAASLGWLGAERAAPLAPTAAERVVATAGPMSGR